LKHGQATRLGGVQVWHEFEASGYGSGWDHGSTKPVPIAWAKGSCPPEFPVPRRCRQGLLRGMSCHQGPIRATTASGCIRHRQLDSRTYRAKRRQHDLAAVKPERGARPVSIAFG
jgi:hypothetical protein